MCHLLLAATNAAAYIDKVSNLLQFRFPVVVAIWKNGCVHIWYKLESQSISSVPELCAVGHPSV